MRIINKGNPPSFSALDESMHICKVEGKHNLPILPTITPRMYWSKQAYKHSRDHRYN